MQASYKTANYLMMKAEVLTKLYFLHVSKLI